MKKPNNYYSTDQNIRFTMLSAEEETAFWVRARNGDETAREFLITNHLLFAHMEAQKISRGLLPKDEVTSAANFAVVKAFAKFDHTRGFKFNTYLRPFIKGEIAALWRSKYLGAAPDPSLQGSAGFGHESSDTGERRLMNDADGDFGYATASTWDLKGNLEQSEDHASERLDLEAYNQEIVAAAMAQLTPREVELITAVYVERQKFADVARTRGCSRQAVEQTHSRILEKLKKILKAEGVTATP